MTPRQERIRAVQALKTNTLKNANLTETKKTISPKRQWFKKATETVAVDVEANVNNAPTISKKTTTKTGKKGALKQRSAPASPPRSRNAPKPKVYIRNLEGQMLMDGEEFPLYPTTNFAFIYNRFVKDTCPKYNLPVNRLVEYEFFLESDVERINAFSSEGENVDENLDEEMSDCSTRPGTEPTSPNLAPADVEMAEVAEAGELETTEATEAISPSSSPKEVKRLEKTISVRPLITALPNRHAELRLVVVPKMQKEPMVYEIPHERSESEDSFRARLLSTASNMSVDSIETSVTTSMMLNRLQYGKSRVVQDWLSKFQYYKNTWYQKTVMPFGRDHILEKTPTLEQNTFRFKGIEELKDCGISAEGEGEGEGLEDIEFGETVEGVAADKDLLKKMQGMASQTSRKTQDPADILAALETSETNSTAAASNSTNNPVVIMIRNLDVDLEKKDKQQAPGAKIAQELSLFAVKDDGSAREGFYTAWLDDLSVLAADESRTTVTPFSSSNSAANAMELKNFLFTELEHQFVFGLKNDPENTVSEAEKKRWCSKTPKIYGGFSKDTKTCFCVLLQEHHN